MKKIPLLAFGVLLTVCGATAQQTGKTKTKATTKTVSKQKSTAKKTETVRLNNTAAYTAFDSSASATPQIADPVILGLNQRAAGAPVRISGSGIVGMPKGSYGFANGKIFLRNTTATSPGAGYGSGSVGTGTSLHSIGTSETSLGVNGKSPYAGNSLWGSYRNLTTNAVADSTKRN